MRLAHVYGISNETTAGVWVVHKLVVVRLLYALRLLAHRGTILDIVFNLENSYHCAFPRLRLHAIIMMSRTRAAC
jgi:hypothetical protein